MADFNNYILRYKEFFKQISDVYYGKNNRDENYYYDNLKFSFDYGEIKSDICFARLYGQMLNYQSSANFILKLPYKKEDDKEELDNIFMNYSKILEQMKNMVKSMYNMEIHKTGYKNVKLITFTKNIDFDCCYELQYSIILIMFCLLRIMDCEFHYIWKKNRRIKKPENLEELLYQFSIETNGSEGHDVNDSISKFFSKKYPAKLRRMLIKKYFNTLNTVFGENGLVNNPEYSKYYSSIYVDKSRWGSHAMQTDCFNYIEKSLNYFTLEKNL